MSVLTLPEAKQYLKISGDTFNDELEAVVEAAEAAIASKVGPLEPTAVTSRVWGGSTSLVLPVLPVISLTSVTGVIGGGSLDVSGLYVDASGVAYYSTLNGTFPQVAYTVTYTAGRETCPADLLMAVKELVRHLWQGSQRGGARPSSAMGESANTRVPGAAYLFPFRVEQLIAPYLLSGFA